MTKGEQPIHPLLSQLQDPRTIRLQAHKILTLAKENQLDHFRYHPQNLNPCANFVTQLINKNYPNLNIPYHSRWRHFEMDAQPRIKNLLDALNCSIHDKGKILYELVIISVLLDAGAGPLWRYKEALTGKEYSRSEGLALASLELYQSGLFSAKPKEPLRVDANALIHFTEQNLKQGFQVNEQHPLEGLSGRVVLLNKLGSVLIQQPEYFGQEGRLGNFYTYINSLQSNNQIKIFDIFSAVLNAFNDIWPSRTLFLGHSLGDVWIHSLLKSSQTGSEYIPFHKLSQWLTYSLIEPLEWAGIKVVDLDLLTGLPEYRNGGLLIDSGVLEVKNKIVLEQAQMPGSEVIVEWRALTIALLDELAIVIREQFQKTSQTLPLAKILQGGTWEAGRLIAQQKRSKGQPPIQIISDGTVF